MASHGTCSPEPCKSVPRKPWRSVFKKDRFLCLSLHPSIPKPQSPFLSLLSPLGFPAPPRPLKRPHPLVSAGTSTTSQSLQLQLRLASRSFFRFLRSPVDLQVGSGTRGQQNKGTGAPLSGARHPFRSLFWAREEELSSARTPSPSPRSPALSRGEQREDAWEVGVALATDQQADPRGTGLRGRGRRWPPRTGLRYFISSLRKPAKSSYASLQCVAFSCHFFFIIKEGVKLAHSLPPFTPLSQKEPNGYEKGGKRKEPTHQSLRGCQ